MDNTNFDFNSLNLSGSGNDDGGDTGSTGIGNTSKGNTDVDKKNPDTNISQPKDQSGEQPTDQPTDQRADQPTDQPTDQPADQPNSQPADTSKPAITPTSSLFSPSKGETPALVFPEKKPETPTTQTETSMISQNEKPTPQEIHKPTETIPVTQKLPEEEKKEKTQDSQGDKKTHKSIKQKIIDKTEELTQLHPLDNTKDNLTKKADDEEEKFIKEVEAAHGHSKNNI